MSENNYQNGLNLRAQVMGEEFVREVQNNTTDFNRPLQDWINEHAWGSTWQRGILPIKYRSLITLAILAALKSPKELKGHIRGALNNGCTISEIQETLLHSIPYCGVPAAKEAFRSAELVISEISQKD